MDQIIKTTHMKILLSLLVFSYVYTGHAEHYTLSSADIAYHAKTKASMMKKNMKMYDFSGVSKDNSGELEIVSFGQTTQVKGYVAVKPESFDSGKKGRDKDACDKYLVCHMHPTIRLDIEEITFNQDVKEGESWKVPAVLKGSLTIRKVTKPIEIKADAASSGHQLKFKGEFSIDITDFGIKQPKLMFLTVEKILPITFDTTFSAKKSS